jgi:hypothetical protein
MDEPIPPRPRALTTGTANGEPGLTANARIILPLHLVFERSRIVSTFHSIRRAFLRYNRAWKNDGNHCSGT